MSSTEFTAVLLLAGTVTLVGCASSGPTGSSLDEVADEYVRLVLAVGRHDSNYVDAYYGPAEWKAAAEAGDPTPVAELRERARELLQRASAAEPSARRSYLEKQLVAVEGFLRRIGGESMTLSEEARVLYDVDPPARPREFFEAARAEVESLVPGKGDLQARVREFRDRFVVPPERLEAVVDAVLAMSRERTARLVELPDGERFETAYVTDKPWNAYNWYKGDLHSLIEFNTDLPIEIGRLLVTVPHEGYPGHHTYNALLEHLLVRGKGWRENTVYALYSPQSLIAEGTANAGVDVILDVSERVPYLRDVLAPIAGLEGQDFETYVALLDAMKPFAYARPEGARMLLDAGASEDEVVEFLMRYGLMAEDRARKSIDFIRTYRAYVFNYTVGEDLVRAYIGDGPDRVQRYFDLLQRPLTPTALRP